MTVKTQVNFVCWTSANVTATIPTEAATPSDAVLLATHAPLRITRQAGDFVGEASTMMSESQVLDEFLNGPPNNGVRVATVLGESGAGKSHLIRWVNAKIPKESGRHVIYLQKTETSLKDVVEALLIGQHDSELDDIRRRVSSLESGVTPEEMEHKILSELAEALRTANSDGGYGKALVGDNGLRLFFIDPLFEHFLLRPGSFIKRRAQHALRGRGTDEPDVPLEFTADELPLDIIDHANVLDAAVPTQKLFRRLVASPQLQREAVRLLNEYLDVAVSKAASLNVGDLGQAFKKIRAKLAGQEIVLLIEDVALIQGVRRDLLDAIIEVGVVRGHEKYATVRTLMAVTPGYYTEQLPETFRRRAEASSPLYRVDVDLKLEGGDPEQDQVFVDFVGRYLNAARVGQRALEMATPTVTNACQNCQVRSDCHAAFGTAGSGDNEYGLYPYNRNAVLRAIRACATRDGNRVFFNPRKVLSRAIRDALNGNIAEITTGNYPAPTFLVEESMSMSLPMLPTHVKEQIEGAYPNSEEAGRVETLLTFWGAVGKDEVKHGVLRAFSHPPINAEVLASLSSEMKSADLGGENVDGTGTDTDLADGQLPRSLQRQLDQIDAWSLGQVLPRSTANELRKIIREALVTRIDWFAPVIREPTTAVLAKAIPDGIRASGTVSIEGADENLALGVKPVIRIERTARNATTFKGLILANGGHPGRAGDALSRLDALVLGRVEEARGRIVAELAVDDTSLVQAAASLIEGAAACGVLAEKPKEMDYVNACLWRDVSERIDAPARTSAWLTAYREYTRVRSTAVQYLMGGVGAAQGDGGVHAIDATRFTAIVRKAKHLLKAGDDIQVPSWCSDAQRRLSALVRSNGQQAAHWQTLVERIRRHLPPDVKYIQTLDDIAEAVKNGQDQGLVKVGDLGALQKSNSEARDWDAAEVNRVERLLAGLESQSEMEKLGRLGTVAGADLPQIATFLESSSRWIEAGIRTAEIDGGSVADVDSQLEQTLQSWLEMVKESDS